MKMHLVSVLAIWIVATLLHEAGHVFAALLLGVRCHAIGWTRWLSAYTLRDRHPHPKLDRVITLAGPAASFAIVFVASVFGRFEFAQMSFCIAITNLLPLPHSDGRRLLEDLWARRSRN
jgi:Zn-dependent protease